MPVPIVSSGITTFSSMNDQIARFLTKLSEDNAFCARLDGAANAAEPEKAVKAILADSGFTFSTQEYRDATKGLLGPSKDAELSDKSLEAVVGGRLRSPIAATSFFATGKLLSRGSKLGGLLSGYSSLRR